MGGAGKCAERQLGRKVAGLCHHLREVGESFGWQKDSRWYANLADSLVLDEGVQGCVKLLEEVEYRQIWAGPVLDGCYLDVSEGIVAKKESKH